MGMLAFALALLYPLAGLCAPVGRWQWDGSIPGSTASAVSVSLILTGVALLFDVALMPPLALGILLSLAFGPATAPGGWLLRMGVPTSNSPLAFTATQIYVSIGYYIVPARPALAAVPADLERMASLLGLRPCQVFRRVTFPLARLGFAAALSLAW